MGPLTPEAELLLQIARPTLDAAGAERIRALAQSVLDWDVLHQMVSRHRLGPFLYVHLNAVAEAAVPRPVFMDLWRTHETNARRNVSLAAELGRLVQALENAGVAALAYKGPVLAQQLYGDVALREFEDLDLLVRAADMPRVKNILLADCYDVDDTLTPAAEAAMFRSRTQYHRGFVHRETGEKVEVHWKTDPRYPVEQTADPSWWDSRPRVSIGGAQVRTFSATEQLLLLTLHASKHQGHRLGWQLDLAQLIRYEQIDWFWIEEAVERMRCRRRVFVSLLLSHEWMGARLPDHLLRAVRANAAVKSAADEIAARFFTPDVLERQALERLRLDLRLCDGWRERARLVTEIACAPTRLEWSRYTLPRSLEFLYVPLRMARLAGKYGRRG